MQKNGLCCLAAQVVGAVVFAAVVTVLVMKCADLFYGEEQPKGRGYTVDIAGTPAAKPVMAGASSASAGASDKPVDIVPYLKKADLKLGGQLIKRCQMCHTFEKGKPNSVGPNQYNLIGRKTASVQGFDYSDAMKAKGGIWTFQALSEFLTAPSKVVPGTKMGFAGFARPEERAAVIAYINKNFSDKTLAIPEK